MTDLISILIQANKGYFYESAGAINAFFEDSEDTKACAEKIQSVINREVMVCGCQLSILG